MWQEKSSTSFESLSKLDKFDRCKKTKTKMLMEEIVHLHLPPLCLLPCLPPHLCCLSLAGYSENIEWKAFSIQPGSQSVSHLGRGDLDGESSLASGFDPRVLWQSLRLRNLDRLLHRPVSPSSTSTASPPLHTSFQTHPLYTYIYICMSFPAQIYPRVCVW